MKASFTASIRNGPDFTWSHEKGFEGEMAEEMNSHLQGALNQTHTPPAILAKETLLYFWPAAKISNFINPTLPPVPDGGFC